MEKAKLIFFGLMGIAVAFELVGDFYFKKWSLENSLWVLSFGLLMYFIGTVFWAMSLKYESLSKAILIFFILSMLGAVFIGVYFFQEQLTILNKAGILLGILSVILVEW